MGRRKRDAGEATCGVPFNMTMFKFGWLFVRDRQVQGETASQVHLFWCMDVVQLLCYRWESRRYYITSGQVESREVVAGSADHATKPAAQSFSKFGMGQERDAKRTVLVG